MTDIGFLLICLIFTGFVALVAYELNYLTESGFYGALIVGTLVFFTLGLKGVIPLLFFFFSSNLLSEIRNKKTRRSFSQVFANGFLPVIFSILWYFERNDFYFYLFLISLGTAISDTWSTEVGLRFKTAFDIKEFKWKPAGFEGGISIPGLLAGLGGAIFAGLFALNFKFVIYVLIFSFLGNLMDSVLGRFVETKLKFFTNNWTNFCSGLISCITFFFIFKPY